jgi:nucleoside-diphosphate kinase
MADKERTLAIVKPDAVEKQHTGEILARIERAGLRVVALKMLRLDVGQARGFYAVHAERPFFESLVRFMTSGPVVVAVLEGTDAIARWRKLMGATNPAQAEPGTLRKDFATDIERNAVHGSDAPATARVEIPYFFNATEIQAPVAAIPA